MGSPIGPTGSNAALRPAGYAPPQQGVQMGPMTNMQPRYSQPGMSMIHPQMGGMPMGMPQQQPGLNHQALATALMRLGGSST